MTKVRAMTVISAFMDPEVIPNGIARHKWNLTRISNHQSVNKMVNTHAQWNT